MQVTDLVEPWLTFQRPSANVHNYEDSFPELFEHYYRFWSNRLHTAPHYNCASILLRRDLILAELPEIERRFHLAGHDVSRVPIVLLVGAGTSNGHAYQHRGGYLVWLPVETYESPLQVRVFVAHELAHALQYTCDPDFSFSSLEEQAHLGRLLMTEGVATYCSRQVMKLSKNDALWADFLSEQALAAWMHKCRQRERELSCFALEHWDSVENRYFFQLDDLGDIYKSRGGYYIGLRICEELVNRAGCCLTDLMTTKRASLQQEVIDTLRTMCHD